MEFLGCLRNLWVLDEFWDKVKSALVGEFPENTVH